MSVLIVAELYKSTTDPSILIYVVMLKLCSKIYS